LKYVPFGATQETGKKTSKMRGLFFERSLRLKKNEIITFEGTISSILNIMSSLHISLKEVKIIQ